MVGKRTGCEAGGVEEVVVGLAALARGGRGAVKAGRGAKDALKSGGCGSVGVVALGTVVYAGVRKKLERVGAGSAARGRGGTVAAGS